MEAVHWRVMKDPIKVAPSQIEELQELMANRIDKKTCDPDHAGRRRNGKLQFNRPIQTTTRDHRVVFCECVDWPSKQTEDQRWCAKPDSVRGVTPYVPKN